LQLQHHKSTGAGAGVGIQSSGAEEFTIMISSTQTFLSLCTYLVLNFLMELNALLVHELGEWVRIGTSSLKLLI
jgi:hypothetical protein